MKFVWCIKNKFLKYNILNIQYLYIQYIFDQNTIISDDT